MDQLQVPVHLQHLVCRSVENPYASRVPENMTYPVIVEALLVHKNPPERFSIYSQVVLRWKPDAPGDKRCETPDFGLINPRAQRPFDFRIGIEAKTLIPEAMLDAMGKLIDPDVVANNRAVKFSLWNAYWQAEDQAKAAVRGRHLPAQRPLDYLLFVGPYWAHVTLGPFHAGALNVRTRKESLSGTWRDDWDAKARLDQDPVRRELYLVGTIESQKKLEEIITSTDVHGMAGMQEARDFEPGPEFVLNA